MWRNRKEVLSHTLRSPECSLFFRHRNGIIKLSIYFQEYNYRTISESAATTVSGTFEMARGLVLQPPPSPEVLRRLVPHSYQFIGKQGWATQRRVPPLMWNVAWEEGVHFADD